MTEDILALLAVHEYFRDTSDTARREVLEVGRVRYFALGEVVYQPEDSFASVGFVLRGRLKSVKVECRAARRCFV